jgi:hypothetical protein
MTANLVDKIYRTSQTPTASHNVKAIFDKSGFSIGVGTK